MRGRAKSGTRPFLWPYEQLALARNHTVKCIFGRIWGKCPPVERACRYSTTIPLWHRQLRTRQGQCDSFIEETVQRLDGLAPGKWATTDKGEDWAVIVSTKALLCDTLTAISDALCIGAQQAMPSFLFLCPVPQLAVSDPNRKA